METYLTNQRKIWGDYVELLKRTVVTCELFGDCDYIPEFIVLSEIYKELIEKDFIS